MRAGLLRDKITFCELQTRKSDSGATKKEYVDLHVIKAYRMSMSPSVGSGVKANEEFIGSTIKFQVHKYSFINEDMLIKYNKKVYKIVQLEPKLDNSYIIICQKEND